MDFVVIATFVFPNDASILESILSSEGIQYFLNGEYFPYHINGSGRTLSVSESDKERAVKIIREAGFERFLIDWDLR